MKHTSTFSNFVLRGIEQRIAEIRTELASLEALQKQLTNHSKPEPTGRKRRPLTLAERRNLSKRMKQSWAERRRNRNSKVLHWTQRPENKIRLRRQLRHATHVRMARQHLLSME